MTKGVDSGRLNRISSSQNSDEYPIMLLLRCCKNRRFLTCILIDSCSHKDCIDDARRSGNFPGSGILYTESKHQQTVANRLSTTANENCKIVSTKNRARSSDHQFRTSFALFLKIPMETEAPWERPALIADYGRAWQRTYESRCSRLSYE